MRAFGKIVRVRPSCDRPWLTLSLACLRNAGRIADVPPQLSRVVTARSKAIAGRSAPAQSGLLRRTRRFAPKLASALRNRNDLDCDRQGELQDIVGELDLFVPKGTDEDSRLAIADETRKTLLSLADDQGIDIQRRSLGLQCRTNVARFLQYPMGNIPRRHSFGDQPVDRIFGDTARMEQADYQARRRAALHLCTPSGRPRLRRAWFEIGHDIDHDRLARPQRFGESGGDF